MSVTGAVKPRDTLPEDDLRAAARQAGADGYTWSATSSNAWSRRFLGARPANHVAVGRSVRGSSLRIAVDPQAEGLLACSACSTRLTLPGPLRPRRDLAASDRAATPATPRRLACRPARTAPAAPRAGRRRDL